MIKNFIFNNKKYFEDFVTRSTYHSNRIEGSTLSYAETYALIFNDDSFSINASPREIYDAINHKYAINYVLNNLDEDLSTEYIKNIAVLINKNTSEISGFRTIGVIIRGVEHIPPEASQVPQAMMYYVYNYNHTEYKSIYEKIADNHIKFERIHPFADGNGRTGRLLINYELLKNNIEPIVIPYEERSIYFKMLADQDVEGLANYIEGLAVKEKIRIQNFKITNPSVIEGERI